MAEGKQSSSMGALVRGFQELPAWRQMGLIVGIALVLALVAGLTLWTQQPTFRKVYSNLSDKDAGMIIDALSQGEIPFKVDETTGAIMVPADKVHQVRMKLAAQGLPKGAEVGVEFFDKEQGFGTSQFMQQARYQRALETELAQSVQTIEAVQRARVHLALPKRSVFLRDRQQGSASVVVNLYPNRTLDRGQVNAIAYMVASSVPNVDPKQVKVVDQEGRLLTRDEPSTEMAMSAKQYEYTRQVEKDYIKRVEDILTPIVGTEGVRAQVNAELDFTVTEQTQERFNPDTSAVRSEQLAEESSNGPAGLSGVPGALSNQPPGGGVAPEVAQGGTGSDKEGTPTNASKRVTRNYEVDRTVSHTKMSTGSLRRLSVAVVVDYHKGVDEEGKPTSEPLSEEEMARLNTLVKEAIGFTPQRGDSVNVVNAPFMELAEEGPPPEVPIWKEPWFWELSKQILGGLAVLFVVFGVLRPILTGLAQRGETATALVAAGAAEEGMAEEGGVALTADVMPQLTGPNESDMQLEAVKGLVKQDPKLVAQTLKSWVALE